MPERIETAARNLHDAANRARHAADGTPRVAWDDLGPSERDDYRRRAAASISAQDTRRGGVPPSALRSTRTFAVMEVSPACFREITEKLRAAGYDHALHDNDPDGLLADMQGLMLKEAAQG